MYVCGFCLRDLQDLNHSYLKPTQNVKKKFQQWTLTNDLVRLGKIQLWTQTFNHRQWNLIGINIKY